MNGAPRFVLTHHPPADDPRGPSDLTFVTNGIESAIRQAREVAGNKDIKLGGGSIEKQAVATGLCGQTLIHLAPDLPGGGVRLFDFLADGIRLERCDLNEAMAVFEPSFGRRRSVTSLDLTRPKVRARGFEPSLGRKHKNGKFHGVT